MSKITNDGSGCFISVPIWLSGRQRVKGLVVSDSAHCTVSYVETLFNLLVVLYILTSILRLFLVYTIICDIF